MIATAGSLCALAAIVALARGHVRDDHVLHPENDSMSSSNTNGTGKTSNIQIAELFDPQKRIMARKNEMTGECILKLMDDHAENSNVQNNYDSKMELSGDEMIEIIGENINDFCGNNVIVLKNFDDDGQLNRSKRSTDKKRYQGQTQTQFVSFGSKDSNQQTKNGLAEAVSQPDLSRATVNGLNGMGQAQSQSSFGDCDECTEQNYRTHPTYMGNSYPSTYPSSEINNNAPSKQGLGYGTGPSVSGQYPNIYPGSGINNIVPGKQDQGFGTGLPVNGQHTNIYPGSGINNIVPGKPDQGFGTGLPANGQHPNIYPGSGINNIVPGKPEQGFGTGPPVNGQHPNVYPDSGINNMVPSKQDQKYGIGSTVDRQYPGIYPGSEINNRLSDKQNLGGNNYLSNQYSHTQSDLGNHKVPGKLYQGYEQNPMPFNTNSHELKKPENTGEINQNMYSSSSGPVNPSVPYYQDKLTNNLSNQQMYPDGSGFPSFPSGSAQGILAPHNIPNNFDLTNPSTNTIIPVTTSVEYQNRPTNYLPSQLINYPHPVSTGLNQITPGKPTSGVSNSLNLQKNVNEAIGSSSIMQNGYPFLWNTQGNHGFTQLNLPSLCNYLYQSCLNALSNNNKLNEFQKTPGLQNTERNSNNGKQYERIVPSSEQPASYPLYGERINPNIVQPSFRQPQSSLGAGGSSIQQPVYIPFGGNINQNQIQPGYGQPQGSLNIVEPGVQQLGYIPSGGGMSPNQIQSGYGQPQGSLGTGGPGVQQSGGNVNPNQAQLSYGQPQGSLSTGGSGGSTSPNQIQSGYGQPQGSLGTGGPGVQKPGYTQSGDVYPNGPSSLQPALDGRNTPGNYPGSYGDNNYRGQQSGPGFQTGNNYLTSSPITGGQFGTDVSSGGSVTPVDTEGGDAQSMTNVNVDGKETSASASAQGKSKFGMTQTQVSGTYSGTGAFTAQAQTSDSDKGAQSRIVSNANGTTSAAQGRGGKGQAQSQVLYNAESGMAAGGSQSSGIDYGTNAQLQAGVKGGVADAQSTGPGSTSSQAQIGFLPHESNNDTDQESLFKGGGAASSQGGSRDGQSQSQLFGSYKHGISYNGAAQASSGKRLRNLPRLDLDGARPRTGRRDDASDNETRVKTVASATPAGTADDHADRRDVPSKRAQPPSVSPAADEQPDDNESEYDGDGDYEDEDAMNTKSARVPGEAAAAAAAAPGIGQVQNIVVNVDGEHDAHVTRDEDGRLTAGQVLDAGQTVPGTDGARIPDGFRGRVVSVAGDRTGAAAVPGGRAQTQTVLLTPGAGGLTVVDKTRLAAMLAKESYVGPAGGGPGRGRFRADADGQTGEYRPGDRDVQYFTKSSTCGYFSFSCNYVDGAKSGRKICKPNQPPYPCQRTDRMV